MNKINPITGAKEPEITAALDLCDFETRTASNAGVEYAILNPRTGQASASKIRLLGKDSDEYLAFQDARDKETQSRFIQAVASSAKSSGNIDVPTDEIPELERTLDELVVLTKGWTNIRWGGVDLEFTPANARMVYRENAIVRAQVKRFVEDRGNFFPIASSPNSEKA